MDLLKNLSWIMTISNVSCIHQNMCEHTDLNTYTQYLLKFNWGISCVCEEKEM